MEQLHARAALARSWLFEHALPIWWERGWDAEARCFHERLKLDGSNTPPEPRRVRVQARQTIVYALAGELGWSGPWRDAVEAGADVLLTAALRSDGGTRHLLAPDGFPLDDRRDLYDSAFVLLGLSEAARALGKRADLVAAADKLGGWIHWYWEDPEGGFAEGEVCPTPPRRQNPHMHLFEALLSFHQTTGDALHLERASNIARLFRDKLYNAEHGVLPEYYDAKWGVLADELGQIVEPGHHFEWSWLLRRWHALGGGDLNAEAEKLRQHAEKHGVAADGAVYDELYIDGSPRKQKSRLWPHTERIKANVARVEATRDEGAAAAAVHAFDTLMTYCDAPTPGLWFDVRKEDGSFVQEPAKASSFYHVMFALRELIRVSDALRG